MNKQNVKLRDIVYIYSGYQFRKSPPEYSSGNVKYIQMRDINENAALNMEAVICIDIDTNSNTYKSKELQMNDILFKNRGSINTAAIFKHSQTAVASHQFLIIRLQSDIILPEFLQWFLNHSTSQSYFKSNATGTGTPIIQKKVIEDLEVIVPTIVDQKKIIKLSSLLGRYTDLLNKQIEKYSVLINTTLNNYLNKTEGKEND